MEFHVFIFLHFEFEIREYNYERCVGFLGILNFMKQLRESVPNFRKCVADVRSKDHPSQRSHKFNRTFVDIDDPLGKTVVRF